MNDKAKQVVTSVTFVGTLLAGFGLIVPATLPSPLLARGLAVAAVIAAGIALALGSLLLHFDPGLRPRNMTEVENLYRSQFLAPARPSPQAGPCCSLSRSPQPPHSPP